MVLNRVIVGFFSEGYMNIFYLHKNQEICAQWHNNKHCVKMIVESAQLLSTTHRILDADSIVDDIRNDVLYKTTHANHPSAIWVRQSKTHYDWLWQLMYHLCKEYTHRYGKIHLCERSGLLDMLMISPDNIPQFTDFLPPPQCMPDEYKNEDTIHAYHQYYIGDKQSMAQWKNREIPYWFILK